MRRHGKRGCACGYAAVIVGSIIFMALILPAWFWWLVCGCLLLCGGIWLLRL